MSSAGGTNRKCEECGATFRAFAWNSKYCPACRLIEEAEGDKVKQRSRLEPGRGDCFAVGTAIFSVSHVGDSKVTGRWLHDGKVESFTRAQFDAKGFRLARSWADAMRDAAVSE